MTMRRAKQLGYMGHPRSPFSAKPLERRFFKLLLSLLLLLLLGDAAGRRKHCHSGMLLSSGATACCCCCSIKLLFESEYAIAIALSYCLIDTEDGDGLLLCACECMG